MRRQQQADNEKHRGNGAAEAEAEGDGVCVAHLCKFCSNSVDARLVDAVDGVKTDRHSHGHPEEGLRPGGSVHQGQGNGQNKEANLNVEGKNEAT